MIVMKIMMILLMMIMMMKVLQNFLYIRPGYFNNQVTVFEEVKVAGGGREKNKKNKK